jgi:hypothetical protein
MGRRASARADYEEAKSTTSQLTATVKDTPALVVASIDLVLKFRITP